MKKTMGRAIIIVMDSFGIGGAPDAQKFGNSGADTLGHIYNFRQSQGKELNIPNLISLGLANAHELSTGITQIPKGGSNIGSFGVGVEKSNGKDTPSGHWEIAGVPVMFDWGYFSEQIQSFPQRLLDKIVQQTGIPGYIGNCHASGTDIIKQLGEKHIMTGKPIFYTSADSVFQIACHEDTFGLDNLYKLCEIVREILDDQEHEIGKIGRVIARPFIGKNASKFERTHNRHDYSILPPTPTLLDRLKDAGHEVISIGKIADIFANQGITSSLKAGGNEALIEVTISQIQSATDNSLIFTNLVDFDMEFGHRRDAEGYAAALEYFDTRLPEIMNIMRDDDILILTADHGCDPTWEGTDHTRENIPILCYKKSGNLKEIGIRESFADIGQSVATHLKIAPLDNGYSFL